ncbi:DUF3102 domain-containing protein [Rhizobium hidalgonense]|uniref:DUF3102 domain-containing protein n=1 Tax=Rhizobium hidalgonense TaxID=1538159 RepID=A0ABX4JXH4_9HYPH|nr:DUF3102 domain-containing protein [Rhizobium hidalgonense]PDT24801.1 hypothetical protein CO674_05545 [Rhizobium hidalgonense]PON05400.1 hypothetical protein ATY29_22855 [Rhizobium hidalgonense]
MSESNRLPVLAASIKTEHDECLAAMRQSLSHALAAGEMLMEAKSLVAHGQWLPWLADNCAVPKRTAQLYMRLAKHRELIESKSADVALLTIQAAVELIDRKPTLAERLDDIEAAIIALEAELADCRYCRKQFDPVVTALAIYEDGGLLAATSRLTDMTTALRQTLDLIDHETDIQTVESIPPLMERVLSAGIEVKSHCLVFVDALTPKTSSNPTRGRESRVAMGNGQIKPSGKLPGASGREDYEHR